MLDIYGSLFFGAGPKIRESLPAVRGTRRAVVVLRLRGHERLHRATIELIGDYATELAAAGGRPISPVSAPRWQPSSVERVSRLRSAQMRSFRRRTSSMAPARPPSGLDGPGCRRILTAALPARAPLKRWTERDNRLPCRSSRRTCQQPFAPFGCWPRRVARVLTLDA